MRSVQALFLAPFSPFEALCTRPSDPAAPLTHHGTTTTPLRRYHRCTITAYHYSEAEKKRCCARVTDDKFCTEAPYESCTKNRDCDGDENKCNRRKTNKNLGVFEVALPLKVPAACWNYGTDTKPHKRCDDVVPRGPSNPGAMLRLSMLSAPTGDGPVWELTSAKAP